MRSHILVGTPSNSTIFCKRLSSMVACFPFCPGSSSDSFCILRRYLDIKNAIMAQDPLKNKSKYRKATSNYVGGLGNPRTKTNRKTDDQRKTGQVGRMVQLERTFWGLLSSQFGFVGRVPVFNGPSTSHFPKINLFKALTHTFYRAFLSLLPPVATGLLELQPLGKKCNPF